MPFKINISDKGKTFQVETESEVVVGKLIGEKIKGEDLTADLEGYELKITGTSDDAGFAGKKGLEGTGYYRKLLTHGFGMKNTQKGIRLRKTLRGEEVSLKTAQINTKVLKEGKSKLETFLKKEAAEGEASEKKPTEEAKKEAPAEKPAEETKPVEKKVEPKAE